MTLTIVTICSIATFIGVFEILLRHNRVIRQGVKTDMNFVNLIKSMNLTDKNCQNRLNIIEEQIGTLYEFHKGEKIKPVVKHLDE